MRMPAPPTCAREAMLNAEVEAVDAAEEVEGVVDDAWVKEPDAEAELSARTGGGPGYGDRARSSYRPRSTLRERRIHREQKTHADAEPDDADAEPLALALLLTLAEPVDDAGLRS
ncbi:hypothetical protein ARMGADRAFT_1031178 [Armillaria gallica]|uniref:Uncharacterized protein n=1 Tax=Armillaria gallica TaxID=47427 RepID=A0A2H3DDV4_ARMGA|nr:hypothetical protein ARMGADRAFT_1031178 [Armillaria gallica]